MSADYSPVLALLTALALLATAMRAAWGDRP